MHAKHILNLINFGCKEIMMRLFVQFAASLLIMATGSVYASEKLEQNQAYQQAYALYLLNHPQKEAKNSPFNISEYTQNYHDLFNKNKKVDVEQFVQYEQDRLVTLLKQRREMSLKQAHVRFNILDNNKDQKMTLSEFQESGIKTFESFDKNKDGILDQQDIQLAGNFSETHDGFRIKLPISMPMPSNVTEFIQQYGQGKDYVTLGDYFSARDKQYFSTDTNADRVVTEQEYVNEFTQRFDQNSASGKEKMKALSIAQFDLIAQGKKTIQANDIQNFAQKLNQEITQ